jgi:hypothetical protein
MATENRKSAERAGERGGSEGAAPRRAAAATAKKKKQQPASSGSKILRDVVGTAIGTEAMLDLVERLGLVDLVVGRVRSKIEETDLDELLEEVTDYLRRNPEVLVVSLGALTVATGLVVWMNMRREWDGEFERRGTGKRQPARAVRKKK